MIGRIKGTLTEKTPPDILIDVNGVGYELQVPMNTFYRLPEINEVVVLHTHFVVREDAQLLYGFYDVQERSLFRALIKINGVGPKLGLAILSGIESNEFVRVVRNNDVNALVCLPGIGKKTAERLIIEMRDKLKDWHNEAGDDAEVNAGNRFGKNQAVDEAESALVALGYKPKEAERAVKLVASEGMSNQDLIRNALKVMAKP
ncbi:MAG: Holliday junction branch migration protein RuvA [Pseudomonadales bacterium]|nr:Holliday junction branch migration protein RuvA [Pseudomonadales bacterium]